LSGDSPLQPQRQLGLSDSCAKFAGRRTTLELQTVAAMTESMKQEYWRRKAERQTAKPFAVFRMVLTESATLRPLWPPRPPNMPGEAERPASAPRKGGGKRAEMLGGRKRERNARPKVRI
jgi:hypothetical protein